MSGPRSSDRPPSGTSSRTFPMRVVTRMTGLSADVVRVWERRYAAITPDRTDGNARRYSAGDIERLTCLRDAIAAGHSIGAIAKLPDAALRALAQPANAASVTSPTLEPYLDAIERLDMPRAEAILARASQLLGPRQVVLELVLPLLRAVGDRWHAGDMSVAQEHAVSAQVRAHLATLIRTMVLPAGAPRMVFATPAGHRHEMGAQMAAVLAAARGVSPVYLGPDVPFEELAVACERARPGARALDARPEERSARAPARAQGARVVDRGGRGLGGRASRAPCARRQGRAPDDRLPRLRGRAHTSTRQREHLGRLKLCGRPGRGVGRCAPQADAAS